MVSACRIGRAGTTLVGARELANIISDNLPIDIGKGDMLVLEPVNEISEAAGVRLQGVGRAATGRQMMQIGVDL